MAVEEDTSDEDSPVKEVTQDSASCSDSSFYEEEEMKSSRNKKEIMMPRIGPGLMMSRINCHEADWPIWRHFIEGTECPGGEACPWGASFLERAVWPEKATYGKLSSRKGGGSVVPNSEAVCLCEQIHY